MKTILKSSLALATVLAVASVVSSRLNAQSSTGTRQSPVVAHITGGSTGKFIETPNSLTTSGITDFAVNVRIRKNGSASGEFVCAIPNVVVLGGQATNGSLNSDGSVTITGMEYGYDTAAGGYKDCSFTVTLRAGGPGAGGFDFADCVFPEGKFDTEVIRFGAIEIRLRQ